MTTRRKTSRGAKIERLVAAEKWVDARRAIRAELRHTPEDHWFLSRLALTYYEQRKYAKALEMETRALQLAPHCPLVLWGLAGTFQMLERKDEAVVLYQRLLRRGVARLANGRCGEGTRWARGLVADCWYRLGQIRQAQGDARGAKRAYLRHLKLRAAAVSIYPVAEVRSRVRALGIPKHSSVPTSPRLHMAGRPSSALPQADRSEILRLGR